MSGGGVPDAIGIVLAGGMSERLGPMGLGPGGKAAVVLGGESSLGRVCRAIRTVVPRLLVVAADGQPLPPVAADVEIVRDAAPHAGPLAALRDGLVAANLLRPRPRWAFVAACDIPLLRPEVVRLILATALASKARFVVPIIGGHPQVLTAAISCDLADTIARLAATGRGPRAVLDDLAAREPAAVRLMPEADLAVADQALDSFLDLDVPADLPRLESRGIPPSDH